MEAVELFERPGKIKEEIEAYPVGNAEQLEQFRIKYIGSKGILKDLFGAIKDIPGDKKKDYGQLVNSVKQAAEEKYNILKESFDSNIKKGASKTDLTRPVKRQQIGSRHPLSLIQNQIIEIFQRIGYTIAEGPEIEDGWHNFTALNIPEDHPARDMQDTFFIQQDPEIVLRTHTSPVQIRTMETSQPPICILAPGRVYRSDNDSTHSPVFHQVEGLYIDEKVSFADLKQTLLYFVNEMFGEDTDIRFRPSFFPFTEPSAELDIAWQKDGQDSWMEILGCGMVDPQVLDNCGIDSKKYTGFAFGMGVERIAMLKYGIKDIRLFYENDVRFLRQFSSSI